MAEKWILAAPGKWEKNGRKMGKLAFFTHFWPFCPFLAIFLPFSWRGQNPFFGHEMRSAPGNQDRKGSLKRRGAGSGSSGARPWTKCSFRAALLQNEAAMKVHL